MDETMAKINALATERFNLFLLAGRQHLTTAQRERVQRITADLDVLWDQYRRELAGSLWSRPQLQRDRGRRAA
ncbi:MAG: hypothetical protein KC547_06060 [Anaerolineae bacterium]|nr:hypothetical protein [Anaerolineae bacterium]